ncbi:FAD-dependent oxidoreductase [Uliginosibacterium sp. TH139]|uniref:flavin monoamine oxidase family protein n=1 Tax=Uliginosibacterium sp. TH139 TaxID=2067453 RepID=UPI000C7B2916|nr:FAD-dependent oxidoreductase [Uliginosibacterium sp. TH139]PLK47800.1 hypothetical protein C0V76_15655 [Uliginosibacterium sp. TH139]
MLDTLVVGAGLCGLSLAGKLQSAGHDYLLIDARQRLGGRIESVPETATAAAADLGPTWFWPATQPRITRLVAELGLSSFPQHDSGTILHLPKGDGSPEPLPQSSVHIQARRLGGGMGTLVQALAQRLAPERVRLGLEVKKLQAYPDHIEAECWNGTEALRITARHVVLALPPRLASTRIAFAPELASTLHTTLRATPTWMAAQCKAVARYPLPFWRSSGLAGNAFVTHAQAVLGEVFDACGENGSPAALGGISALPPAVRIAVSRVHELMVFSQFAQLFGPAAAEGELFMRDWAQEPFTCSALDIAEPAAHPQDGVAELAAPQWGDKLIFGGSETAGQSAGYLEGALDAAARIWQQLSAPSALRHSSRADLRDNHLGLEKFARMVALLREESIDKYVFGFKQALIRQQREDITQLVLTEVVAGTYKQALEYLHTLPLELAEAVVENGRASLTPALLAPFMGFSTDLLSQAQTHNASSCAISGFPLEQTLNHAYVQAIRRDLAALWREFALALNEDLLQRMEAASQPI